MSPKISVLMAAHNNAATIERSIESILSQTFKDFEFIITDDASTDATPKLLEEWAKKDDRIKISLNKTNEGLAMCLNQALAKSSGEFIARQDAHARSLAKRLEREVEFLNANPSVDVVGTAAYLERYGRNVGVYMPQAISDDDIKQALRRKNILVHGSVMMRAKVIKDNGGYNPAYRYVQDFVLWRKLANQERYFAVIAEPLYVLNAEPKSLRVNSEKLLYLMNALENNETILPLRSLPVKRKIQFCRYQLRYLIKRFLRF